uniref:G-protein coupled receptors family 1 profile domain-containing protein n=1 Tax=Musca domestica TaxID=7370 RepID=A0A1I8MW97_MUSDO
MAIDFLILAVLLVSFVINFLALAAFWATPGLRSTANRFTINLLIINLTGCVLLAPTLFLSCGGSGDVGADGSDDGISSTTGSNESGLNLLLGDENDDSIEFYSKPGNQQMTIRHNGRLVEKEGIILRNFSQGSAEDGADRPRTIETIYKCNTTFCRELTIDEGVKSIVITEIEEENIIPQQDSREATAEIPDVLHHSLSTRSWSIDMAAALGAMAVLLIVGDTWCAVTDPLRYHSRISGVKSWILIGVTWTMGVLFGALSALREIDFESEIVIRKEKRPVLESSVFFSFDSASNIFSVVFSCAYFLLIILLPFGFVCGMYWRIISEARGNGLRMRQNGSSPLLQSAINLTQTQQGTPLQPHCNSLFVHRNSLASTSSQGGGLQMQIDLSPIKGSPTRPQRDPSVKMRISDDTRPHQELQNIILTLQTPSGECDTNYSVRVLESITSSPTCLYNDHREPGIRQVHSSPNLQRNSLVAHNVAPGTYPHQLLGSRLPQNVPGIHLLGQTFQQSQQHSPTSSHQPHHHSLQIPPMHSSSKTLSYMSSLRHRLSNASSLFKYREESRAARISILVVIMFLISYLPFGCLVVIQSRMPSANFRQSNELAIFMVLLAIASSPFIFAYRIKRVRRGVKRLVSCDDRWISRKIQRHNSCSSRLSANLNRNNSRVSAYSSNSTGGHLTPLSTPTSLPHRSNSCCHTFINMTMQPENAATSDRKSGNVGNDCECNTKRQIPTLQPGITVVEQIPLNDSTMPFFRASIKSKFLQLFFRRPTHFDCVAVPITRAEHRPV